ERGKFTTNNTNIVFFITLILSLSLPTNAIRDLLYRYFYLNKDTLTPFINSIMISVINIILIIILSIYIGLIGVVIGTVLSSYVSLLFISIKFKKMFKVYFNFNVLLFESVKITIITSLSILIMMIIKNIIYIDNVWISFI